VFRGFSCTGAPQTTKIPSTVQTAGILGGGGDGGSGRNGITIADDDGGQSAGMVAAFGVNPGETLTAYAGCAGGPSPTGAATGGAGGYGWRSGGNGGDGNGNGNGGGGGGGATAVVRGSDPIFA